MCQDFTPSRVNGHAVPNTATASSIERERKPRRGRSDTTDKGPRAALSPGSAMNWRSTAMTEFGYAGYVGIPLIGRTTMWTRVGAENRLCREERR